MSSLFTISAAAAAAVFVVGVARLQLYAQLKHLAVMGCFFIFACCNCLLLLCLSLQFFIYKLCFCLSIYLYPLLSLFLFFTLSFVYFLLFIHSVLSVCNCLLSAVQAFEAPAGLDIRSPICSHVDVNSTVGTVLGAPRRPLKRCNFTVGNHGSPLAYLEYLQGLVKAGRKPQQIEAFMQMQVKPHYDDIDTDRETPTETEETLTPVAEETKETHAPSAEETEETPGPAAAETEETPGPAAAQTEETIGPAAAETEDMPAPVAAETEGTLTPAAEETEGTFTPAAEETEGTHTPAAEETEETHTPAAEETEEMLAPAAAETEETLGPAAAETGETPEPATQETDVQNSPAGVAFPIDQEETVAGDAAAAGETGDSSQQQVERQVTVRGTGDAAETVEAICVSERPLQQQIKSKQVEGEERQFSTLKNPMHKIRLLEHGLVHRFALAKWLAEAWLVSPCLLSPFNSVSCLYLILSPVSFSFCLLSTYI